MTFNPKENVKDSNTQQTQKQEIVKDYGSFFDDENEDKTKENNYQKITLDKKIIGQRLRKFRSEFKITQVELANVLNTTHSTISAYESGKTMILTIFAYEICKKYNISMDWICGAKTSK